VFAIDGFCILRAVPSKSSTPKGKNREGASVLLEVVLALALFIGAATVISGGISASVEAVNRVRLQTHAVNLAISVMSELQIGARPLVAVGPENFEAPFKDWLYRVNLTAGESATENGSTRAVEVIVWHTQENIVHRITQLFRASELTRAEGEAQ
jgi:type II secretory pathway pseudopilin PulG